MRHSGLPGVAVVVLAGRGAAATTAGWGLAAGAGVALTTVGAGWLAGAGRATGLAAVVGAGLGAGLAAAGGLAAGFTLGAVARSKSDERRAALEQGKTWEEVDAIDSSAGISPVMSL